MMLPTTVRTAVSPDTLAKVTRLFNGTAGDVLTELLQNARRAGATRLAIATWDAGDDRVGSDDAPPPRGRLWLVVTDDGHGIADPAALLTLGRSGWETETLRSEDPAGMGLFALAGRRVRVASCGAAGPWTLDIPADAWTTGADLALGRGADHLACGTRVAVEMPEAWLRDLKAEVERAARHFPLPVTFNGAEVARRAFLDEALHIETWRGLRLGVVRDDGWGNAHRINVHGVTVPCPLPRIAEVGGEAWTVRVDVVDCPDLQLVLPARKEVVTTPFLDALRAACERMVYRYVATRDGHRLPFEQWRRAAELGIPLPPAAAALHPWSPCTNDPTFDPRFRDRAPDRMCALPAAPLVVAAFDPDREQSLARAIRLSAPEARDRLVAACAEYRGYGWYDALPRVVAVVGTVVRGAVTWTTEEPATSRLDSGPVDRAAVDLTIATGETTRVHRFETDLLLVADDEGLSDEPDEQGVYLVPGPDLTPVEAADAMVAAFFTASDDAQADSWETQAERYDRAALDCARRHLLGQGEADLARIRDAVRDHLSWLVPKDRALDVRFDAACLEVRLMPISR